MFSERLENLIKATIQDGVLTDQEKAAIIKRAQAEGEDVEEVDIYIQSLLQERQQTAMKEAQAAETERMIAQKKEREAKLAADQEAQKLEDAKKKKCPICGEYVTGLTNVCPHCKHIFNGNNSDDKDNQKALDLMQRISKASNHLYFNGEKLYTGEEKHYVRACDVSEWEAKNGKPIKVYSWMSDDDPQKYYWEESFDYYFSDLSELETLYGELPNVKKFIHDQRCKEINLMSEEIRRKIERGSFNSIADAKMLISMLSSMYASVPEAQTLCSNYQKIIEDKSKGEKKLLIGFGVLAVIVIILTTVLSIVAD